MSCRIRTAALGAVASFTLAAAPAPTVWTPDFVHSRAEFTVSHLVLSKVWGHVPIRSLDIETPAGSVIPDRVDAVLDAAHEDTDDHDRDEDLRSATYFDVARYPTMTFHSTAVAPDGPDDARVTGDMTIKSVTKRVTFPIHVVGRIPESGGGTRVAFHGEFHLDRRDFGIVDDRLSAAGVLLVGYDVTIGLTVEATTASTAYLHDMPESGKR